MFYKFFLILLFDISVCLAAKPELFSSKLNSNREIILNENDPLEIYCRGSDDLILLYPKNLKTNIISSRVEIVEHEERPTKTKILKRSKTVYGDTGWYGCVSTTEKNHILKKLESIYMTPYNYNESDVKWAYVYVKPYSNYFTRSEADGSGHDDSEEPVKYSVSPGKSVVFPCLPTSPSLVVTLYKNLQEVELNGRITYDPKRGFSIKNATPEDGGLYFCSTDQSSLWFTLDARGGIYPRRPKIRSNYAFYLDETKVTMTCEVEVDKNITYALIWKSPQQSDRISAGIKTWNYSNGNHFLLITENELTIENFTSEDQGVYQCQFYEDSELRSDFMNVTLTEDGFVIYEHLDSVDSEAIEDSNDSDVSTTGELNDAPAENENNSTETLENTIIEKLKPLVEKLVREQVEKYLKENLELQLTGLELLKSKIKNVLNYALEQI